MNKLLEPGRIGSMNLKNRVYMAPMGTGTDLDGGITAKNVEYFAERAKGGAGLIFTAAQLATEKYESRAGNKLDSFQHVERLHFLADRVHHYGAKLCVQISAGLGRVGASDPFTAPSSSSATHSFWFPDLVCKPLTVDEIQDIVTRIGYSAQLAMQAGADCVELHAYGGYLLDQFQASIWNLRDDEYGGDLSGRMKFTLEAIAAMKKSCGKHFPVLVKFTPVHGFPGGRTIDEGIEMAKLFEAAGVDALHIDYGCYERWYNAIPTVYQEDATQIQFAAQVRKAVGIPILSQGKLGKPEIAEAALEDGCADFIGLGHSMLCEPHWVNKVKHGFTYDIVPCIGCNECLYGGFAGVGSQCAINPLCGHEKDYSLEPVADKKRILVVGGGPAGMQAAIYAAQRGIEVELWEQNSTLGGTLLAAGAPSFKSDVLRYVEYASNKLYRSGATVRLSTQATAAAILKGKFDAVILAAGSTPLIPNIPGIELDCVKTSTEVLLGKASIGEKCVVIGGGLVGCETALAISEDFHKEPVIIEMLDGLLLTANHALNNDLKLRAMLEEKQINSICGAAVTGIQEGRVFYTRDGREESVSCDTVVLACGYKPTNALAEALMETDVELAVIGDCSAPRKIFNAVHEAFHTVRLLFH